MVGRFQSCTKSLMVERRGESFDSTKYNRGLAFANHQVVCIEEIHTGLVSCM